jgi:hypothetical protein
MAKVPYEKLDANVVELCRALNSFKGVHTIGSCGGHENPGPSQWPAGQWYVLLTFQRDEHGHFALEFLAWLINHDARSVHTVILYPDAAPPYLNRPGQMLRYALEGEDYPPEELAELIQRAKRELYVPPERAGQLDDDELSP